MWDELKDATTIHLYKKGNCQLNDKEIVHLSIQGKIGLLARVLLNHLIVHLKSGIGPTSRQSQYGFRAGRETIDMIFAARQLLDKCQEKYDGRPLCNLH